MGNQMLAMTYMKPDPWQVVIVCDEKEDGKLGGKLGQAKVCILKSCANHIYV